MQIGLHALGIGPGADPAVITGVAREAERAGFATLLAGEHVVMVDGPDTVYPYSDDGRIAVPADASWLDPFAVLAFAASATASIRLATGILLLPEHNPLIVAKQAASLDVLSRGRLTLGVGIGWSAAEFAALGVPFEGRGRRTREYVEALRVLWRDDPSAYSGEFVDFAGVRSHPKPVRGNVPVVLGGNSDAALKRVAQFGDGWYGFYLSRVDARERLATLARLCEASGRDLHELSVAVALTDASPEDLPELEELGVTEAVLVESPPSDPADVSSWIDNLAAAWPVGATPRR